MHNKITLLIPLYNEAPNVQPLYYAIKKIFAALPQYRYELILVDDGSTDNTLREIKKLEAQQPGIFFISFSRNFGKDNALMAGLQFASGDAVITMDADLQHPPEMIPVLLRWWEEEYEVVYTYRKEKNKHAGIGTQLTSKLFYKTINRLSEVHLEDGIADFRLMDKKVVSVLLELNENNPFFRGLLKWTGFKQKGIPYTPNPRQSGETKYNHSKLLRLALSGITSFSTKPLVYAIYLGFFFSGVSLLYIPYALYSLYTDVAISGWASIIVTIAFFGGLQLVILGILGLYLGRVFIEVKERPRFIISETSFTSSKKKYTSEINESETHYTAHL